MTNKPKPNNQMKARYHKMRVNGKQVNVARYVLEQKLGRKLQRGEFAHHINGDKLDDRPENLEVVTTKEHAHIHLVGKPGNRKGKHHTPEAIARMSAAKKGKKHSPESNQRRSETMRKHRQEHPELWANRWPKSD